MVQTNGDKKAQSKFIKDAKVYNSIAKHKAELDS